MKNQYFGDINDYKKYGLIRCITSATNLPITIAWMLTPDDGGTDGKFISYLDAPGQWEHHDPELFQKLTRGLTNKRERSVSIAETQNLVPKASYFSKLVPDGATERNGWLLELLQHTKKSELVFLDPDNGIEVKSKPYGRINSSKYVFWPEIQQIWSHGKSLLIYQHFPHEKRPSFTQRMLAALHDKTEGSLVCAFSTANVVFLLALQPKHQSHYKAIHEKVAENWSGAIEQTQFSPDVTQQPPDEITNSVSALRMTEAANRPDVQQYLKLMREINRRLEVCDKVLKREIDLFYQRTVTEFLALQLRLILESIILSSLSAHSEVFERTRKQLKKEYKVANLVAELKKHNPYFFPVPLSPESSTDSFKFVSGYDDSLTLEELVRAHGQTGELLHVPNPYKGKAINYQDYIRKIEQTLIKTAKLLATHSVMLYSHDEMIIIFMKDPESGQPQAFNGKAVGPITFNHGVQSFT